ncbi:fibrillin-2-like [Tigriopus californicus]|nr:fibrillin-2-like [Tigriopus californicus]
MTMYPITSIILLLISLTSSTAHGRQSYARYQRGDQGPDVSEELSAGAINSITESRLPRPIGGPNVCRSRDSSFCCPGWVQRGATGLCLIPVCSGCGNNGRCFRPNMCICQGGQISPNCGQDGVHSEGCESTCLNGGTCKDGECLCRPGYTGEYCQEPVCKQDCENGGRCIGPNRCACVYGYTGRYCEIDYRTGPCYRRIENGQCTGQLEGVVCTRQLCCATIGEAWGHPCEECPDALACEPGFLKNVHTGKCMDINECEAIPDLCTGGQCTNTEGSFQCECPEGMVMDDNHQCSDQDECALFSNEEICPNGRCINKDPGYYCLCAPGYIPSQDQKTCLDTSQGNCYSALARNGRCRNKLSFR